jgi:small neutral amino acid transporter SnatA (MarC family)
MNFASVLPLTVVMIAGPQVIAAVFLASSREARRSSLAYLLGAGLAVLIGLSIWYVVFAPSGVRGTATARTTGSRT